MTLLMQITFVFIKYFKFTSTFINKKIQFTIKNHLYEMDIEI